MQIPTTHNRPTTTKASLKLCSSRSIRKPEQENRDGKRRRQQEPSNQSNKKHSSPTKEKTTLVDAEQLTLFIYKHGLSSLKLFCKFHNKNGLQKPLKLASSFTRFATTNPQRKRQQLTNQPTAEEPMICLSFQSVEGRRRLGCFFPGPSLCSLVSELELTPLFPCVQTE
jgi:hypothetical protein